MTYFLKTASGLLICFGDFEILGGMTFEGYGSFGKRMTFSRFQEGCGWQDWGIRALGREDRDWS